MSFKACLTSNVKNPVIRIDLVDNVSQQRYQLWDVENVSWDIKSEEDRPYAFDNLPPSGNINIECNNVSGLYTLDNTASQYYKQLRAGNKLEVYMAYKDIATVNQPPMNISSKYNHNTNITSFTYYPIENSYKINAVICNTAVGISDYRFASMIAKSNSISNADRTYMINSYFHFYNTVAGTTTYDDFNYSYTGQLLSYPIDISDNGEAICINSISIAWVLSGGEGGLQEEAIIKYGETYTECLSSNLKFYYKDFGLGQSVENGLFSIRDVSVNSYSAASWLQNKVCDVDGNYDTSLFSFCQKFMQIGVLYWQTTISSFILSPHLLNGFTVYRGLGTSIYDYKKLGVFYLDEPEVGLERVTIKARDRYSYFYDRQIQGLYYTSDTALESIVYDVLNQNLGITTSNYTLVDASGITLIMSGGTTFPNSITVKEALEEVMKCAVRIDNDGATYYYRLRLDNNDKFNFEQLKIGTVIDSIYLDYCKKINPYIDKNKLINSQYVSFHSAQEVAYPEGIVYENGWTINANTFEITSIVQLQATTPSANAPLEKIRYTYSNTPKATFYEVDDDSQHDATNISRRSYNPATGYPEIKLTLRNLTYDNIYTGCPQETVTATITIRGTAATQSETISGISIRQTSIDSYGLHEGAPLTSFLLKSNTLCQNIAQAITKQYGAPREKLEIEMCQGTCMSAWGIGETWSIKAESYGISDWTNYLISNISGNFSVNKGINVNGTLTLTKINT